MRWIGIVGFFAALASISANAQDANGTCLGLREAVEAANNTPARNEQPFLTENRCEAMEAQELRAPLMRIPQEDEDPLELSLGVKGNGGMIRLKIPFSF